MTSQHPSFDLVVLCPPMVYGPLLPSSITCLADLNESIRLDPSYAMVFLARGDLYKSQGDLNRAMADLNESIRLNPNYAPAYFTRGRLSYMTGNNPGALEDFGKAIRFDPEDATAYFNRGVAYYVVGGRLADAEADFKKASELNPKDAYAALWYLQAQPYVRGDRIGAIGWSQGGGTVLWTIPTGSTGRPAARSLAMLSTMASNLALSVGNTRSGSTVRRGGRLVGTGTTQSLYTRRISQKF